MKVSNLIRCFFCVFMSFTRGIKKNFLFTQKRPIFAAET